MKKVIASIVLRAILVLVGPTIPASAQDVVFDQRSDERINQSTIPFAPTSERPRRPGQEFKPAYPWIDFVDLNIWSDNIIGPAQFDVRIHQGTPSGTVVGISQSVEILFPTPITRFFFPASVPLTPEAVYVMEVVQIDFSNGWGVGYILGTNYASGRMFIGTQAQSGFDLLFREGVILPRLSVSLVENTNAQMSWPANFTDYVLEAATNVTAVTWGSVTNSVSSAGNRFTVTTEIDPTQRFFRLRKL